MPDIEYSTFQFNWLDYPAERKDEVSPWLEAFVNAKNWIDKKKFSAKKISFS
jgi:phosphoribosylformylglycinamidine synthase